jgi:hypothetical protein
MLLVVATDLLLPLDHAGRKRLSMNLAGRGCMRLEKGSGGDGVTGWGRTDGSAIVASSAGDGAGSHRHGRRSRCGGATVVSGAP